jgi:hypothetical protein
MCLQVVYIDAQLSGWNKILLTKIIIGPLGENDFKISFSETSEILFLCQSDIQESTLVVFNVEYQAMKKTRAPPTGAGRSTFSYLILNCKQFTKLYILLTMMVI